MHDTFEKPQSADVLWVSSARCISFIRQHVVTRISFLGLVQGPGHGAPALEAEYVVLDFQLALERTRFNGIQLDSAVFVVFVSVALTRCSELTAPP